MTTILQPTKRITRRTNLLRQLLLHRRLNHAIRAAYSQLLVDFPECDKVLFDELFLMGRARPFLLEHVTGEAPLKGNALAALWDLQFGFSRGRRSQSFRPIIPVATHFLSLLDAQLA